MPLSERTRIEVFIPDLPLPAYRDLLSAFQRELSFAFGGCSTIVAVDGYYVSAAGQLLRDTVNLVLVDTPLSLANEPDRVSRYAERLKRAATRALSEEAVLVTASSLFHEE